MAPSAIRVQLWGIRIGSTQGLSEEEVENPWVLCPLPKRRASSQGPPTNPSPRNLESSTRPQGGYMEAGTCATRRCAPADCIRGQLSGGPTALPAVRTTGKRHTLNSCVERETAAQIWRWRFGLASVGLATSTDHYITWNNSWRNSRR